MKLLFTVLKDFTTGNRGVFVAGNLSFAENEVAKILLKLEIEDRKNEDF